MLNTTRAVLVLYCHSIVAIWDSNTVRWRSLLLTRSIFLCVIWTPNGGGVSKECVQCGLLHLTILGAAIPFVPLVKIAFIQLYVFF